MTRIEKVGASITEMPSLLINKQAGQSAPLATDEMIKKALGEPIPKMIDPSLLPAELKEFFAPNGLLKKLARKLKRITKKDVKNIIPASNTIASVDEENLYVGVDFLKAHGNNEALIASVLAHEWGHLISDSLKNINADIVTWDELFELRRDEEASADGFAGRALFLMGYEPDAIVQFLKNNDENTLHTHKYHDTATRVEIVRQSYKAMEDALETAQKIFENSGVKFSRVLGDG